MTIPFLLAGLVLCVAGLAKLWAPEGAADALQAAGQQVPIGLVRGFAALELALGAWAAVSPGPVSAAAVALLYVMFSGLSLLLARRRAACGCFGTGETPASGVQSLISAALAAVALAAALGPGHGIGWILGQHAWLAGVLVIGLAGAVYGTVIAYTQLPAAWGAWSVR
jgi:hypothetical protein